MRHLNTLNFSVHPGVLHAGPVPIPGRADATTTTGPDATLDLITNIESLHNTYS